MREKESKTRTHVIEINGALNDPIPRGNYARTSSLTPLTVIWHIFT